VSDVTVFQVYFQCNHQYRVYGTQILQDLKRYRLVLWSYTRSYKRESVSKFDFGFRAIKLVGNDSSPHLKTFGEVSKPLSAEMSKIFKSRPKLRNCPNTPIWPMLSKNNKQFSLIINYPVSYNVDKAYKVVLGLFLEVLGQKHHSTEWERQTRVKCLRLFFMTEACWKRCVQLQR